MSNSALDQANELGLWVHLQAAIIYTHRRYVLLLLIPKVDWYLLYRPTDGRRLPTCRYPIHPSNRARRQRIEKQRWSRPTLSHTLVAKAPEKGVKIAIKWKLFRPLSCMQKRLYQYLYLGIPTIPTVNTVFINKHCCSSVLMLRPTVWNSLSSFVRTTDSFTSLRSQLKT